MTKLEHILQELYKEGKIDIGEVTALYGSVYTANEFKDESDAGLQFKREFGTVGAMGVKSLLRKE